jgi:hypothetical protein
MPHSLAMSRGLVVLDENVENLKDDLRDRNIKVLSIPKGTKDEEIITGFISSRIFLTANTKDFISEISSYEFGLISLDNVKKMPPKDLAKLVSDAIKDLSLWGKKSFLCVLHKNKKHEYKEMRV